MKNRKIFIIGLILIGIILFIGIKLFNNDNEHKETNDVKSNKIHFVAVGDNLMHERLLKEAENNGKYDFSKYYENIKKYIQDSDLAFVNQETVFGGEKLGYAGYPNFNTPEIMGATLQDIGFDIVNGATNHALDKGIEGLNNSIENFKKYEKLTYIGLYSSKEDRDNIRVIEKNGIKIALLSYNQMTNGYQKPNDYCINSFDEETIKKDLKKAKEESDFVIVSCHWGEEYQNEPNNFQKKYAKILAENGADLVVGTHSHTLQKVEKISSEKGETLIAYSLGNFISGMMEFDTQIGGMLSLDIVKKDGKVVIENEKMIPLVNHYEVSDKNDVYNTRKNFTVYRFSDYNDTLASKHGLNGYQGIKITKENILNKAKTVLGEGIKIEE